MARKYNKAIQLKVTEEMDSGLGRLALREARRLGVEMTKQAVIRRLVHRELVKTGVLAETGDA